MTSLAPIVCIQCNKGVFPSVAHVCDPDDITAARVAVEARAAARANDDGTVIDWRTGEGFAHIACPLTCGVWDAATGEAIVHVFHINTVTSRLGRYALTDKGKLKLGPDGPIPLWETRPVHFGLRPPPICFREFL